MRLLKILIGVIVVLGLLLAVSPLALQWYLTHQLEKNGFSTQIKRIGINYIFGQVRLEGIDIARRDGSRLRIYEADLKLSLWAARRHQLILHSLKLNDAHIDLPLVQSLADTLGLKPGSRSQQPEQVVRLRRADFTNVEICRAPDQQCLRLESGAGTGLEWRGSGQQWHFSHSGPVRMQKAFLRDQSSGSTIFYLGELEVAASDWSPKTFNLRQLAFDNFHLVENTTTDADLAAPYQIQLGHLSISSAAFFPGQAPALNLGEVKAVSLRQALHKGTDGRLRGPANLAEWLPELAQARPMAGELAVSLKSLEVQGGVIAWTDKSVNPFAQQTLSRIALRMGAFDTRLPALPTPINLSAGLGASGSLTVSGEFYPLRHTPRFTLQVVVAGLDLANISAYSQGPLQQPVTAGVVDASVEVELHNGQLEALTRWRLADLRFDPSYQVAPESSLQQAFQRAADHNRSVMVSFPVRGRLGEDVTATYVLDTLMRRALREAARGQNATTPTSGR